jgi:hypothetical protein
VNPNKSRNAFDRSISGIILVTSYNSEFFMINEMNEGKRNAMMIER